MPNRLSISSSDMIVGLTGGIGSGKSTIARELAKQGFAIYDCDREAKRIIAEDKDVQQAITDLLGHEAFADGVYNTKYVAKRVFEDSHLRQQLNAIVHPAVKKDILQRRPDFIESAILFEAGLDEICDKIVIVEAPEDVRIERVIARDYEGNASPANIDKVRARIRAQKTSANANALQRPMLTVVNDGISVLSGIVNLICDFAAL